MSDHNRIEIEIEEGEFPPELLGVSNLVSILGPPREHNQLHIKQHRQYRGHDQRGQQVYIHPLLAHQILELLDSHEKVLDVAQHESGEAVFVGLSVLVDLVGQPVRAGDLEQQHCG